MNSEAETARTVYLLCPSWHGATLIGMLLGNHPRALSLGDTLHSRWPFPCRCGRRSDACAFWQDVRARAGITGDAPLPRRPRLFAHAALDQAAVTALAAVAARLRRVPHAFEAPLVLNRALLATAQTLQPFDLFVDGCKSPTRYAALRCDPALASAGVIHLLRDPRAFAAAAKRRGQNVAAAATAWVRYHRAIGPLVRLFGDRLYRLRYEDFCAAPTAELERLQGWLDLPRATLLHRFDGSEHWTGSGSVNDFDGTVRLSTRWRKELDREETAQVNRIAGATAARFGYAMSPPGDADDQ